MSSLVINNDVIKDAMSVIPEKIALFVKHLPALEGKFDEFGRAKVAQISAMTESNISNDLISAGMSYEFKKAFDQYLKEKEYSIKIGSDYRDCIEREYYWSPQDFVDKKFHVKNKFGKLVTVNATKVLNAVHDIWMQMDEMIVYKNILAKLKELRTQGLSYSDFDVAQLTEDKKHFERGNWWVTYNALLNENNGSNVIWLSVNPLDKLTASGMAGDNPTKFSSCWSISLHKNGNSFYAESDGCYSNPRAGIAIGKIINCAMLYIANGTTLKPLVDNDFQFVGYKERSHIWLDEKGWWIEKLYPTKSSSRKEEFKKALMEAGFKITTDDDIEEYEQFSIQDKDGIRGYFDATEYGNDLFLDRVVLSRQDVALCYLPQDRMDYSYDSGDDYPNSNYRHTCPHCGERYNEDDMRWVNSIDDYVCESCFEDNYRECERCGNVHDMEDMVYFEENDTWYCERHAGYVGFRCDECDEWHLDREGTYVTNSYGSEVRVCEGCLEDNYFQCDHCDNYHHNDTQCYVDGEDAYLCERCHEIYVIKCKDCGKEFYRGNAVQDEDTCEYQCDDCFDEWTRKVSKEEKEKRDAYEREALCG